MATTRKEKVTASMKAGGVRALKSKEEAECQLPQAT